MKKIISLIIALFLFLSFSPVHADIKTGLAGWWKFNDGSGYTVTDSSGNGNNGLIIGYPKWTTWPGSNGALQFDGSCEFVRIPYSSKLKTGTMTIAVWLQIADILKINTAIYGWGRRDYPASGCADNYYGFIKNRPPSVNWYEASYMNLSNINKQDNWIAPVNTFSLGSWNHWVTVYNADDRTIKLYKNGSLVTPYFTASDGILNCGSMTAIGTQEDYCPSQAVRGFSGKMADFRVYTRALSADDIMELYNATKPTSTNTTAPDTPTGLTATAASEHIAITLSWNASNDNAGGSGIDGYIISRSTTAGGPYVDIATVPAGTTTWTDRRNYQYPQYSWAVTLSPSTTYYYKVKAFDKAVPANISSATAYKSATTIAAPATTYSITVHISGTFAGQNVNNTDWGIACRRGTCTYKGIKSGAVVLMVPFPYMLGAQQPAATSGFNGWLGNGCKGKGSCLLVMDSDKEITAYYGSSYPPSEVPATSGAIINRGGKIQ
ncbi:MAG TPA: LamG-like jellyroll fold domain-containing protein [Syntrophales bacterium]|nr:LamG-like jellyroll fold domain-containing protein [Syntrophales bacterium]